MALNRKFVKIGVKIVFGSIGTVFGGYVGRNCGLAIGGLLADGVIDFVADTTIEVISESIAGGMGVLAATYITDELVEELLPEEESNRSTDSSQYS
jgi:hypothetical protein